MSTYVAERIEKPSFFKITPLQRGSPNRIPYNIGFDSEAENGYPFLYQFAHPDGTTHLIDVPKRMQRYGTLFLFLQYLAEHCKSKKNEYIVWGFNLNYEYTQLFRDLEDDAILAPEFQIGMEYDPSFLPDGTPFILRALNDKRYSFTVELGRGKRIIKVLDAMAYFPTSLDNAARAINAGKKFPKPREFSRKAARTKSFIEYASQDAVLTQRLGEYITALHRDYDVPMTMTAPHFAARTFRRQFLKSEIPLAHPNLEQFGLDSYHGGKNGFYLGSPALMENIHHVDIRSAYPEAMRQLPDLEKSEWQYYEHYIPNVHAIWEIEGIYDPCIYRCLKNTKSWLEKGKIYARVTSYELDSVMRRGEFKLKRCVGYVLEGPPGGALVAYVDRFFSMKRHAANSAERTAAKLFLNSLYGKFFQKVPLGKVGIVDVEHEVFITTDPDQPFDYVAGGLYHPPIAALITGFVRAKIHDLEHRHKSIMTSTDGFFSYDPPPDDEIGEELGQLDTHVGTLRIWRERLYIFTPQDPSEKSLYALHGWRGTVNQLKRVPLVPGNIHHYTAMSMITLKMSKTERDGKKFAPGTFARLPFKLLIEDTT